SERGDPEVQGYAAALEFLDHLQHHDEIGAVVAALVADPEQPAVVHLQLSRARYVAAREERGMMAVSNRMPACVDVALGTHHIDAEPWSGKCRRHFSRVELLAVCRVQQSAADVQSMDVALGEV